MDEASVHATLLREATITTMKSVLAYARFHKAVA
jgi:hypothetical protein